jgi:hypothetical protein
MALPEILRKEAERLYDRASLEPDWEKEQEFIARAEHLENRARELEGQDLTDSEQALIRLRFDLEDTNDPVLKLKIQSAIDRLTERET